jgi:hypothetical protein
MGLADVIILIGSALLVIEGVIKLFKSDFAIRGSFPSSITAIILGVGLLLKSVGL